VGPRDRVSVNGHKLEPKQAEDAVYLAFNKPVGVTSTSEPGVRGNIVDYVNHAARVFPIGRLDKDSSGSTYSAEFAVPAGEWQYKIAINDGWDESYSADGTLGGGNTALVLVDGPARLRVSYDDTTHRTTITPTDLDNRVTPDDSRLAADSLRNGLTKERFYFLMADRFANGDTANDTGGLTGDRLVTGLDRTDKDFYHGGDLQGVTDKLDYIKGLGTTAIWLTPSFKNRPVQGSGADVSAATTGTGSPTSPRSTRTWAPTPS
jgi:hypothetical protein